MLLVEPSTPSALQHSLQEVNPQTKQKRKQSKPTDPHLEGPQPAPLASQLHCLARVGTRLRQDSWTPRLIVSKAEILQLKLLRKQLKVNSADSRTPNRALIIIKILQTQLEFDMALRQHCSRACGRLARLHCLARVGMRQGWEEQHQLQLVRKRLQQKYNVNNWY